MERVAWSQWVSAGNKGDALANQIKESHFTLNLAAEFVLAKNEGDYALQNYEA